MAKAERHKWEFRARFRRNAFGWKSQPAIKRVKEAVSEIKKIGRKDKVLAAAPQSSRCANYSQPEISECSTYSQPESPVGIMGSAGE